MEEGSEDKERKALEAARKGASLVFPRLDLGTRRPRLGSEVSFHFTR